MAAQSKICRFLNSRQLRPIEIIRNRYAGIRIGEYMMIFETRRNGEGEFARELK